MVISITQSELNYIDIKSNSWFDIKRAPIISGISLNEYTNKYNATKQITRTQIVQLFPNKKQSSLLKKWLKIYNYAYNATIRYLRKQKTNSDIDFRKLRPIIKDSFNNEIKKLIKLSKIPSHTIDYAIKDVVSAYNTCFSNIKAGNIKHFLLRYKKMKSPRQTLALEGSAFSVKNNTFCPTALGKHIKSTQSIVGIKKTARLTYNKHTNKWILGIPIDNNITNMFERNVGAIDGGSRTFLTVYGNDSVIQIGNNSSNLIRSKLKIIDATEKKIFTLENKNKMKYNKDIKALKKAAYLRREKLKNQIKDMHYKAAKYLCQNYKAIRLGKLSTKSCISNKRSVLNNTAKRDLVNLAHYSFSKLLKAKGQALNCDVQIVCERLTSKVCCNCNFKNKSCSSKTFLCSNCNFTIDRDVHSGFNIFKKHLASLKKFIRC